MSKVMATTRSRLSDAKKRCVELGLRMTVLRETVLELILSAGKPVKAYDLLGQIDQTKGASAPPTIYRTLDFLLEHGFIHKLQSINAYVCCEHNHNPHQGQFLICDRCNLAQELDDPILVSRISQAASDHGFQAQRETVEVHGLCKDCLEKGV